MAMGRRRPLLDCLNCPPVTPSVRVSYQVYAQDAPSVHRLLANAAAREALARLMGARGGAELYLQPVRMWYRTCPRRVADAPVEQWLLDLIYLAGCRP
jgi:hypothetical protein